MLSLKELKKKVGDYLEKNLFYIYFARTLVLGFRKGYLRDIMAARKYGLPVVSWKQEKIKLRRRKNLDHLFVLGGGQSVNDLGEEEFSLIRKNISIGINKWFVHSFVPDYLMVEGLVDRPLRQSSKWLKEQLPEYINSSDISLLLKDLSCGPLDTYVLGKMRSDRIFALPKITVPGRTNAGVRRSLETLRKMNLLEKLPFFSRVSVVLGITIAAKLGIKSVVLCGVDLNKTKYFWQESNFELNQFVTEIPETGQEGQRLHSTIDPTVNPITADEVIQYFANSFYKSAGVVTYVSSESSKLSKVLPVFDWKSNKGATKKDRVGQA